MLNILIFQIGNTLFMFGVIRVMGVFFEKRNRSTLFMVCSCLFALLITNFRAFFISDIFLMILINLAAICAISLNYKSSLMKRLTAISCTFSLGLVLGATPALYFLTGLHILHIPDYLHETLGLLFFVTVGPVLFLTASLLRKRLQHIRKQTTSPWIALGTSLTIPIALVTIELSVYMIEIPFFVALALQMIFLICSFFPLLLQDALMSAYESKLIAAENSYYLAQCRLMQESMENVRSIRHDMKNHLVTLKDYSVKSDASEVTAYLNRLLGDIKGGELYSNTGNIAFDSIVNYKLRDAEKDHIACDVNMFLPSTLQIDAVDVITILGNLLDNALNAVAKANEKVLRLHAKFDKGGLFIKIENTFNGEVFEGNQSGYGMKNIRQAIEKYDGSMDVSHAGKMFAVSMVLLVDA